MRYHHIALSVSNLEKSVEFYKKVFGFFEVKRFELEEKGLKVAFLKLNRSDNLNLELFQPFKPIKNKDDLSNLDVLGLKHIAFEVEDANSKFKELEAKNFEVTEPREGKYCRKYFFIKDPDGFIMEFYQK